MVQPHYRPDYASPCHGVGVPRISDPTGGGPFLFPSAVHACIHVPGGAGEQGLSAHSAKGELALDR